MASMKKPLKRLIEEAQPPPTPPPPPDARLQSLINCLSKTLESEADCAEFDAQMDCLAEFLAQGVLPLEDIPANIQAHLQQSRDCKEEFEALIAILKAEESGDLDQSKDK
jgi:hypothetical protein